MICIVHTRRSGFTLLELSIVLVIIGLIVGGILTGRVLIEASEYRAQIADIEKLRTAANTFKLKYNCLPGDCVHASMFFNATSQPAQVQDGNGNGMIEITDGPLLTSDQNAGWGHSIPNSTYAEWVSVFDQLGAAQLWNLPQYDEHNIAQGSGGAGIACANIRFSSAGNPSDVLLGITPTCMAVGYIPSFGYLQGGNKIAFTGGTVFAGNAGGLNPWEAQVIDAKLDDGLPLSGKAVVIAPGYIFRTGIAEEFCAASSVNTYRTVNTMSYDPDGDQRNKMCDLYLPLGL